MDILGGGRSRPVRFFCARKVRIEHEANGFAHLRSPLQRTLKKVVNLQRHLGRHRWQQILFRWGTGAPKRGPRARLNADNNTGQHEVACHFHLVKKSEGTCDRIT